MNIEEIVKKLDYVEKKLFIYSFIVSFFLILCFGIIKYPNWLDWIDSGDFSALSFMQIIYLNIIFIIGLFISLFLFLDKKVKENERFIWIMASLGFLFLSVDAKYQVHNQIRHALKVKINFLWFEKGDFVLTFILILCLIFAYFFLKYLSKNKKAFNLFIIGAPIAVFSVMLDSIKFHNATQFTRDILYAVEEISETSAMLLFLNSFFSMFCFYLKDFFNDKKNEVL